MNVDGQAVKHEVWSAAVRTHGLERYENMRLYKLRMFIQIPIRLTLSTSEVTTVEAPPAPLHVGSSVGL